MPIGSLPSRLLDERGFAYTCYGITTVPESFFPPVDRDMFSLEVTLPTRSSFANTERTVREMDKVMAAKPGLESVDWFIGKSAAPFCYNLIERRFGAQNYANAMVKTHSADEAAALILELELELLVLFPQAQIVVRKLTQGPPVYQPVEVCLWVYVWMRVSEMKRFTCRV